MDNVFLINKFNKVNYVEKDYQYLQRNFYI